jgi:hypothetical protein
MFEVARLLATLKVIIFSVHLVNREQAKLDSDTGAVDSPRVVAHVKSIVKLPKTPIVFAREVDA